MAAGGSGQQNLRKAIGAIKDSTLVGIAKVNSEYKDLDVAILKATNHVEALPKEKHVRNILGAVSGSRPRADVVYCIDGLARRLAKTRTWAVALKTLIVVHRALREVDHSFCEELIRYNHSRGHMFNLLHFKDESSPSAWDNSTWIRAYALYLEECLECFRVLKYDFHRDHSRTKKFDTPALLEQLPALQQLLFRLLACRPAGAAQYCFMIQYALSIVAAESVRLYVAISDGVLNLVDKYFEMQRHDAVRALEIYRKAGDQAQWLSNFFEVCRSLEFGRRQKYVKIEQLPASFLTAMEEYVKDVPQTLMLPWRANEDKTVISERPSDLIIETGEGSNEDSLNGQKTDKEDVEAASLIPDLLSWDEPCQEATELTDKTSPSRPELSNQLDDNWELALVIVPGSDPTSVEPKKEFVLDRSTLDSLYDMALSKTNQNPTNSMGMVSSNPFEADCYNQDTTPYTQTHAVQPHFMQMEQIPQQQALFQEPQQHAQEHDIPQQQPSFQENQYWQQEKLMTKHDLMHNAELPQAQVVHTMQHQQQEQQLFGNNSANSLGNPFVEQYSLACASQSQSSNSSLI